MCASDISKLNHTLIAPVVVLKDTPSPLIVLVSWLYTYLQTHQVVQNKYL